MGPKLEVQELFKTLHAFLSDLSDTTKLNKFKDLIISKEIKSPAKIPVSIKALNFMIFYWFSAFFDSLYMGFSHLKKIRGCFRKF
jgi:hypothetical protein